MITAKIKPTHFLRLCAQGNLIEVKKLLEKGEDPSAQQNAAIYVASLEGRDNIVALLLHDKRINPADRDNAALRIALIKGHDKVIECLMKDKRIDCTIVEKVKKFSNCSLEEIKKALLEEVDPTVGNNIIILKAFRNKHLDSVKFLLEKGYINPACHDNYILKSILSLSRLKEEELSLLEVLLQPKNIALGVDPTLMNNKAICLAMQYKRINLFKQLLTPHYIEKGVDPNTILEKQNLRVSPLSFAVEHGLIDILRQLLQYKNINLKITGNLLLYAIKSGSLDMFTILFEDKRIDPAENYNEAIRAASALGFTSMVQVLLSDKRVNPHPSLPSPSYDVGMPSVIERPKYIEKPPRLYPYDDYDEESYEAYEVEYEEIETHWFDDKRTQKYLDFHCSLPICSASKNGHSEVVKILLQDERVDPIAEAPYYIKKWLESDERSALDSFDNLPILRAIENGHIGVVVQLLSCEKVKKKLLTDTQLIYHLTKSLESGHFLVIEYLFKDREIFNEIISRLTETFHSFVDHHQILSLLQAAVTSGSFYIIKTMLQNEIICEAIKDNNLWYTAILYGHLEIAQYLSQFENMLSIGISSLEDNISSAIKTTKDLQQNKDFECLIKKMTPSIFNYLIKFEQFEKLFVKHAINIFDCALQNGKVPVARLLLKFFERKGINVSESFKENPCYQLATLPELTYLCAWKISTHSTIRLNNRLPQELRKPIEKYRSKFV